jgi:hypothetical protein
MVTLGVWQPFGNTIKICEILISDKCSKEIPSETQIFLRDVHQCCQLSLANRGSKSSISQESLEETPLGPCAINFSQIFQLIRNGLIAEHVLLLQITRWS